MAKQRTLAEAAKGHEAKQRGYEPWYVVLKRKNPTRMAEINQWIGEWESGGCREAFPTRNALAAFIAKHCEGTVKNPPPVIRYIEGGLWRR